MRTLALLVACFLMNSATAAAPDSFEAWHALAEVNFSLRHH